MTTIPHRVIRMCIFQQPVYIHLNPSSTDDKSNDQNPIHFSTFPRDQSCRLGLVPTYPVSLSIDETTTLYLTARHRGSRPEV